MSSFSLSGGVEVLGFISPTDTSDQYAVIDPLYGIDGLRNVSSLSELNAITSLRRRSGMVVGVNNGSQYYKLNPPPWNGTISDWSLFNPGVFTGGTVTGNTVFTNNLSASVFSAATYLNLPIDNTVTGGTYNPSNGSVTFVNNTGGTFTVTGFITGFTDIRVTGYTYSNNTFTIFDSSGNTFSATINTMTGLTVSGLLSATTISASTYQNLPITTLTVNSTPISGGTPNGVLFQSPTNVLSANDGFVYSGTFPNNFVGINSPTPQYSLDVNGAIYQRTGELLITSSGGVNKEGPFIASSGGTNRTTQLGILDNSTVPVGIDMFETNNSFPSSYINFRVNNADLVRMSGSFVGIGTTTDAGFRLDVNGTARIQNQLTTTGSITASSGTSRGTFLNQTLVAAANNDTLYALDITPSFTTGSFTGVTSVPLRIRNSSGTGNAFFVDGIGNGVLAGSLSTPTVYNTNNINLSSGSGNLSLQTNFAVNTGLVMFNSTRNIVIQNGGTFTDAGFRLDVSGNTRINGGLTATTISATTYQNLPSDVIIINSTPIQSGFTGGILFQSSASTVSQSTGFTWDNTNGRLGIGTITPTVPLEVTGNIRSTTMTAVTSLSTGTVNANVVATNGGNMSFLGSGTAGMILFQSTRNIVIQNGGTFTDAGFSLDVIGTARISGATQILSSLSVTGNLFGTFYSSTGGFSSLIANYDTGGSSVTNNYTGFGITRPFNPTGGVTTYDGFRFNATINQTGGASGTTRGLYITPIISAATDFRAIETTNGRVIISDTLTVTGSNATSLLDLSQNWNTSGAPTLIRASVTAVTSNNSSLLMDLRFNGGSMFSVGQGGITRGTFYNGGNETSNTLNTGFARSGGNNNTSGTHRAFVSNMLVSPTTGTAVFNQFEYVGIINQTGGANGITRGFYSNPTLTSAFDFRAIETTVGNVMLNTVSGNTLIGTSTNSIYKLDVSGSTRVRGNTIISATTSTASGSTLTVVGSGSTQPIFTVQGSSGELFSVTDSLIGSLFSVNDISGLPILEVFSNNTVLMGTYLAPSLNTTSRVTANSGTTTVYTIPQSAYTGAFFEYTVSDGTNLRAGNIMSIWSGVTVNFTETQTTDIGSTSGLTFTMSANTSNVILQTSATTNNWIVKTIIRSI
jgi:hypothetical protein